MFRSRPLLQKVAKSITEASKNATKDAGKDAAKAATASAAPLAKPIKVDASKVANDAAKDVARAAAAAASAAPKNGESLLLPYIQLHHHKQPNLLPDRNPGSFPYLAHHISSAAGAIVSLCSCQEARDRFLVLTKDSSDTSDDNNEYNVGIINTSVLGHSDMGFLKSLTLFEDLNNPLYQEYPKLNLTEFMRGCSFALEEFHKTTGELLPKLINNVEVKRHPELNENEDSDVESLGSDFTSVLDIASKDPDSLESTFVAMTTPEMFNVVMRDGITQMLLGAMGRSGEGSGQTGDEIEPPQNMYGKGIKFIKDDTKVMNVALLTARVEEIYPPVSDLMQKEDNDPDAPLEDDSLMPFRDDGPGAQVVTQVEVLYELQQSSVNEHDGKTHTQTSVMVGKFETCLGGDPNGSELQWRLAAYRPAVEFSNTI